MYAGQAHLCPICNARLTAPMPASGQTTGQPRSEVVIDSIKQSIQAGINEAGITTLPRYMADRNITGGIELITSHVEKDNQSGSDLAAQQDGRYRIGKVIEQGGMGIIFNTRDINIRRDIAMKVIGDPKAIGRNGILRFIEEAQITGQLEHPGIIPLHELCSDASGNFFYTMKLIKGRTLFNILDSIRTGDVKTIREYPLSNLLIIFQKICDAMAFSHSKMVIHRDLKPENIMIGEYGEVQVMDWGLAKILPRNKMKQVPEKTREPQSSADDTIIDSVRKDANVDIMKTMAGTIMGTLGFMAPEQARGETVNLDERTDIYGLGSILYEILTLHPPIKTGNLREVVRKITTGDIPHPTEYNPDKFGKTPAAKDIEISDNAKDKYVRLLHLPRERVPDVLAAVAMKAMAVDPLKRYQHVKELQGDIEAFQNGYATSAEHAGIRRQIGLFVQRHKTVIAMVASILTLIFAGTAISITQWVKAEKARTIAETERAMAKEALADLRETSPDLVLLSQRYMAMKQPSEALKRISFAVEMRPDNPEFRYLQGNILQTLLRLEEAENAYAQVLKINPGHKMAKENLELCRKIRERNGQQTELSPSSIYALYLGIHAQDRFDEATATITSSGPEGKTLESFMQNMIDKAGIKNRKVIVDKTGLCGLDLSGTGLVNLPRLKDIPLGWLNLGNSLASDLSPLKGMPLSYLNLQSTPVSDLSPLNGMSLTSLNLDKTPVSNLSVLRGMPLTNLNLASTMITDLSQLKGMPLCTLSIANTEVDDLSLLRNMPLTRLDITQTMVIDLSPLKGMPLSSLYINNCPVWDLSPLKNLPLYDLNMRDIEATDFSPLKDMQLSYLNIAGTRFTDLTPLKTMPLIRIICDECSITNLNIFQGMKTLALICGRDGFADTNLTFKLLVPAINALKNKNTVLARKEIQETISTWEDVPAMSNICSSARLMLDVTIPLIDKPHAIPPGARNYQGHHYAISPIKLTWDEAKKYCESVGGYLATLTSIEEQNWLLNAFPYHDKSWLGGFKNIFKDEWQWVTGEKWVYVDWYPGEPSDTEGIETVLEISREHMGDASKTIPKSFIIEWNR